MAFHEFTLAEHLNCSAEALAFAVRQALDHDGCGLRERFLNV